MRNHIYYKLLVVCILCMYSFAGAYGQEKMVIRGKVVDKATGEPIPGVNIVERDPNARSLNGTVTDFNGYYMIPVARASNTELLFSYIGYESVTIPIRNQTEINVSLKDQSNQIGAVTVVAQKPSNTGIDRIAKRDMTGSVSKIEMKELDGLPITSVGEALQGRAAGVMATSFSGDPGSGMQIQIRGVSSISASNKPLYVINGMPVISEDNNSLSGLESNPMSDIPPEDIESIEILKDAAAVALWGTRAANGVVIINTKRGAKNETKVGISTRLTLKVPRPRIPMLDGDGYKSLMNEADQNRGGDTYHNEVVTNLLDNTNNADFEMYNNNTNWTDAIESIGFIQNYAFNLTGGGNSARYRFSTSYENNTGPILTTSFDRLSTNFSLDYDIASNFSISTDISFTDSKTRSKDISDPNGYISGSVEREALVRSPLWPIYLQDRNGITQEGQFAFQNILVDNDRTMTNPLAFLLNKQSESKSNRLLGKINATLRPLAGLMVRADVGGDFSGSRNFYFIPPTATGAESGDKWLRYNKMRLVDGEQFNLYARGTVNYFKNFDEVHDINLTLFSSLDMGNSGSISATAHNIASSWTPTLSTAANYAGNAPLTSGISQYRLTSTGMRFQYKLYDRYILSGSYSRDGSSRFGPKNRYANLPTLSARWRISHESFMKKYEFIDDLSLRYSWGKSGNGNISNYTYFSRYSSSTENSYAGIGGVQSNSIRLDNIRWETTTQQNISFTGELINNRLNFEFSYYNKYTSDLLQQNSKLPVSSGFSSLSWFNSGDVRNSGLEFDIKYDVIAKKTFRWEFGFNISTLKNVIVKLPANRVKEGLTSGAGGYYFRRIEGDPLGSFYGYEYKGVYAHDHDAIVRDANGQTVYKLGGFDASKDFNNAKIMKYGSYEFEGGDAIYTDVNHDGIIDQQDIVMIGNMNPDFFGGANTTVAYKGFSVSLFFQYSIGNDVINLARMGVEDMNSLNNQSLATARRWRKQGDQTDIPKAAHLYKSKMNILASDRFVEDASYMRLKSMQCSYSVPRASAKKVGIDAARIFFNITNMFTWTKYLGQDPEVNGAVDNSFTAQPVMYTLGTALNF